MRCKENLIAVILIILHLGWNIASMFLAANLDFKQDLWSNIGSILVGSDLRVKGDLVEFNSEMTCVVPWK